jgi:hypothetical protein
VCDIHIKECGKKAAEELVSTIHGVLIAYLLSCKAYFHEGLQFKTVYRKLGLVLSPFHYHKHEA